MNKTNLILIFIFLSCSKLVAEESYLFNRYVLNDSLVVIDNSVKLTFSLNDTIFHRDSLHLSTDVIKNLQFQSKYNMFANICIKNLSEKNTAIPIINASVLSENTCWWEQGFAYTIGDSSGPIGFLNTNTLSGSDNILEPDYFDTLESSSKLCKEVGYGLFDFIAIDSIPVGRYWILFTYKNIVFDTSLENVWNGIVYSDTLWFQIID